MQQPSNVLNAEIHCPYCDKYGAAAGWVGQYTQEQLDTIAFQNLMKEHHGMFDHLKPKEDTNDPAHQQDTPSGK